uniref:DNA/pantothenate metabolism flavoprotein C-terminal domain-containing protein n=1 Tax=Bionectria ochroleuca TaxID=29856 RepID=A0A0B7K2Y8_BIOOC
MSAQDQEDAGYAVIFLHREFSLTPYARHFSHATTGGFLDFLEVGQGEGGGVRARPDVSAKMADILSRYHTARTENLLLSIPFLLLNLVDGWAPRGMVSSFKLETDPTILVTKARYSLERYQHHLVIGNLLATRKWEVVFVSPGREDNWLRVKRRGKEWTEEDVKRLRQGEVPKEEPGEEIERFIIPAVKDLHDQHIKANE